MDTKKGKALEAADWRVGSAGDFLGLTPEEERYIETKLLLMLASMDDKVIASLPQEEANP